jgi:hypothetical protein
MFDFLSDDPILCILDYISIAELTYFKVVSKTLIEIKSHKFNDVKRLLDSDNVVLSGSTLLEFALGVTYKDSDYDVFCKTSCFDTIYKEIIALILDELRNQQSWSAEHCNLCQILVETPFSEPSVRPAAKLPLATTILLCKS